MNQHARDPLSILFVTSNLHGGGTERALVTLINHIDRTRFRPYLALFQREGIFLKDLSEDVEVYAIQPRDCSAIRRNWIRVKGLGHLHSQIRPSLIMGALWQANAVTVLAALVWRFRVPVVIAEQGAPRASMMTDPRRRLLWPVARRLYRKASHIVANAEGIAKELRDDGCAREGRISVIYNPIPSPQLPFPGAGNVQWGPVGVPIVLAAGRLVPLKNHALLLRAAALVLQQVEIQVVIIGDGPERGALGRLASALGISDRVLLLGFQHDPGPFFAAADVFVHTSDHEGLPNVMVEAMNFGVPIVSTDCPVGPAELLANGEYGMLVPCGDAQAVADAILSLFGDQERRNRYSSAGKERSRDFSPERIVALYEELFTRLVEEC